MGKTRRFGIFGVLAILTLAAGTALAGSTIIVNEDNVGDDWQENTAAGGTVAFVTEFGAPAGFGNGALKLETSGDDASRAQLNSDQDEGMLLADIDHVGYHTYVSTDSTGSGLHAPSINIAILADGQPGSFTTLVFEPIYTHGNDAINRGEWQSWDASGQAKWWSTQAIPGVCARDCFVAFDDIKAANLEAVILSYAMNLGTGNPDIISAVDEFTVGDKTFDFEPKGPVKEDCKQGGWQGMTDADGNEFRNQGDCVSYFASGGRSRGR